MKKITKTLCMLIIACMSTAVQAIAEEVNYMTGWDAGGDVTKSPGDAGWETTDASVKWTATPGSGDAYQYRDNLGIGRAFMHPANHAIFSYPVNGLKAKTFYQFNCSSAHMNGTCPTTFAINSTSDGSGMILGLQTKDAAKWDSKTSYSFKFAVPTDGKYYLTWQTRDKGDRCIAWGFNITELGAALTVTFNTDGGNSIDPQYLLSGANETAIKPTVEPTKEGYIFKGWYVNKECTTEYDFTSPVTTDITIYAGWQDIKTELRTLITTATSLLTEGTEKGQTYLNGFISAAQTVVDNASAEIQDVTAAFNNLTTAITVYQDASLKELSVAGNAMTGFSATVYQYTYSLALSATDVPVVTANVIAECADYVITPAAQLPGNTTIVVTAGNGQTQIYTINFIINYMSGWDADGTNKTPGEAGWLSTNTGNWNGLDGMQHCYRDDIKYNSFAGRTLTTDYSAYVYAYPVTLTGGKTYKFTGRIGAINGGSNPASFNIDINTSADRVDGVSLAARTYSIQQTTLNTYLEISFFVPVTGTYYFTFEGTTGCRGLLANLALVELPAISASNISTFSNDALIAMSELKLEGDFTADNITALNAKLGVNNVLTSVDLTKATVATDAVDVFAALNPNTLKYFVDGATVPATWTNTVIGNTAVTITLTDGYNFNNVKAFTTSAIAYKRTFAKGWSTFGLPFAMTDISELGSVEKFSEVKDNTIIFDAATEIIACNPYLINAENEAEKIFSATNTEVPVTVAEAGIFNTTFNELTATEAEGKFILTDEGEVQKFSAATTETTIPAFRAYITIAESEPDAVYNVEHKSNDPNVINNTKADDRHLIVYSPVSGTIIIDAATDQEIMICSIDGRLVRKVIVAGGESKTINDLAKGIYLVNNQKVVIK